MDLQPPNNTITKTNTNTNNNNVTHHDSTPDLPDTSNGDSTNTLDLQNFADDIDSSCSTPYVSAPSSPGRGHIAYFYSAPASPMHFVLSSTSRSTISSSSMHNVSTPPCDIGTSVSGSFEFEFSARFATSGSVAVGSMSSADELFLDGKIRPMKLSTHLQRPQVLAPLLDLDVEDEDEVGKDCEEVESARGRDLRLRDKSLRRRTRSLSPLRSSSPFQWEDDEQEDGNEHKVNDSDKVGLDLEECVSTHKSEMLSTETTPSVSASSSRSSSAGRSSKRWVFLKDFLYRSKSEGRSNGKFWSNMSFSPAKEKKQHTTKPALQVDSSKEKAVNSAKSTSRTAETKKVKRSGQVPTKKSRAGKSCNGVGKRRIPPSPHELHYTANRAQAEEMRKKTFLPYRQGLLGCLGFSSKGYGAMNGLARALNPVSSR